MMRTAQAAMAILMTALIVVACSGTSTSGPQGTAQPRPRNDPPPGQGGLVPPNDQPYPDVFFNNPGVNPFVDTEDDHLSTFALDVDTASYTIARRYIRDGNKPDKDGIRVEEFVNSFPTGTEPPAEETFAIHIDGGPTPFVQNERYTVARIAIQSRGMAPEKRPDAALTFVIDVSGSMAMENRLELVKESLGILVGQLRPRDTVAIVVYGSEARTVLRPTPIGEGEAIRAAIASLHPEGSTNAEAGLLLGYDVARRGFREGGINRIILASDGVANVGNTGPESILSQIRKHAAEGIALVTLGFGMGNYNDVLMEQLADDGDGFYAYVDTRDEAERLFVDELTATLVTVAFDSKVQVDWNPDVVERYRLLGFENRDVKDEQFRDDTVEAGAIGAGHTVTALYELKLKQGATGKLGTVTLRWTDPDTRKAVEMAESLNVGDLADNFGAADRHFRLATTVAAFAEVLRESYWSKTVTLAEVASEAAARAEEFPGDATVKELADLVRAAARLNGD
jgi:Ca-activated chloride channel family protein